MRDYLVYKMAEGTVKFFNRTKNFGFISGDDGKDLFVHGSDVAEGTTLDEGDKVSFDVAEGEKGPKAENVKKLEEAEKAEEAPAAEAGEASEEAEK